MYKNWIMDDDKLSVAKRDAIYMHPLPADRDVEVTSKVLDGPNSVVFDQAENRLHAQKAVMALTMA
jgi:N-acetylornithine carbamoyltransferase